MSVCVDLNKAKQINCLKTFVIIILNLTIMFFFHIEYNTYDWQ